VVGGGLWATGALWLIFHYFLRPVGEFGPEPHMLEPWWLGLHGLFAFLSLTVIGLLCGLHIGKAWASKRRRWSGSILLGGLALLSVTGWMLLYVGDDGVWGLTTPTHWMIGLALPVAYGLHRLIGLMRK
jgi:hypothetical protein